MEQALAVPELLCGTRQSVRRKWRAAVRRAAKEGTWAFVDRETRMVPLDQAPRTFVLEGPDRFLKGEHVLLFEVMTELGDITYLGYAQVDRSYQLRRDLVLEGLHYFWFNLGILGAPAGWMIMTEEFESEKRQIARTALKSLLSWWPTFERLDGRFADAVGHPQPWPSWGYRAFFLCTDLGVDESELRPLRMGAAEGDISPSEAARRIASWL